MNIILIPQAFAAANLPASEFQVSNISKYSDITAAAVIGNIIDTLTITIFFFAGAAFLLGALMYTAGFINEENNSKGKKLMIGALIGMAVVQAANVIFNTVFAFVYG